MRRLMNGEEPGLLGNLPKSRPGTRSAKRAGSPQAGPRPAPPEPDSGDPVTDAVKAVVRTAGGVTREILRRLPRP